MDVRLDEVNHHTQNAHARSEIHFCARFEQNQWARIYALNGSKQLVEESSTNQVVYVLALEGDAPDPKWRWWEQALDTIVQTVQPAPAMTHIELVVPSSRDADDVHFATYLGKHANWTSEFGDCLDFYLNPNRNGRSWRAVPVMAHGALSRLRKECNLHVHTPYGSAYRLFDYPFSVPPLRSLAWALSDEPNSNAHCASLVARCLKRGLPELYIPEPSAWYGPSTLFLELTRQTRLESYRERMKEMDTLKSLPESEEAAQAVDTLLRGSDDSVRALSAAECRSGVDHLCSKCVTASTISDVTMERIVQKQLAMALLRSSLIARAHRVAAAEAETETADENIPN